MKKLLFTLLVFLCALIGRADFTVDNITYWISNYGDNEVYVSHATIDGDGTVIIPAVVSYNNKNYTVTGIRNETFRGCTSLTSITIPNSVTYIGWNAFSGCTGLTEIIIPNSVKVIENEVFCNCTGLTTITIPNSVTYINNGAFRGCTRLTETIIPHSVTEIGSSAFMDCTGLSSITIPNSVTYISWSAFENCTELTKITIPNSVKYIGMRSFSGCNSLPVINNIRYADTYLVEVVDKSQSLYTIKDGTKFIGSNAFEGCTGLTSVSIPNSVTSIGDNAFKGCTGLTSISIPNSVTRIGNSAFEGCTGLEIVNFLVTRPFKIDYNCFSDNTYENATLVVLKGYLPTISTLDYWSKFKDIVEEDEYNDVKTKMDTNGDGDVNSADVVRIYNYIITGE